MDIAVILYNIRSAYNVGSIFRTADAANIKKVYLTGITPAPLDQFGLWNSKIAKVALGAEKTMAWESFRSTKKVIQKLKKEGYEIVAIEQSKRSKPFYKFHPKKDYKLALVLGAEVNGLPKKILQQCEGILEIPMNGSKESLNVSVAFGIIIFSILYS